MIYLPKRAVFIHIPRTAGNSITNAIAKACAGRNIDVIIGTAQGVKGFGRSNRHIRAVNLKKSIPEWEDIYKFAIHRPLEDRLESTLRLIDRDIKNKVYLDPTCRDSWKRLLTDQDFLEHNIKQLQNHTTEWFTLGENGEDLGIELYDYNELSDKWYEICDKCQIPRCELPHLNKA